MDKQINSPLTDRMAQQLHALDPMGTCCNVNEGMEDEYAGEARHIVEQLETGIPIRDAVKKTFDQWFWEGCLEEKSPGQDLNAVVAALNGIAQEEA